MSALDWKQVGFVGGVRCSYVSGKCLLGCFHLSQKFEGNKNQKLWNPKLMESESGWWFQTFFIFHPNLGEDFLFWPAYFSIGLVQLNHLSSYGIDSSLPRFYLRVLQVEVSRVFPPANVRRGERLFHPTAVGLQTLGTNPGLGTWPKKREQNWGDFFWGKIGMFGWDGNGWFIHFICFCLKLLLLFSGKF